MFSEKEMADPDTDEGGEPRIQHLISARKALKSSLEKSKSLASSLQKTGPILDETHHRLASLEVAVRPLRADREALLGAGGHISRAVGPAAAVLKVFDAIHGLEKSMLSDPSHDLASYLSAIKRLEEALGFLGDNCGLAIQWLEDIVEYIGDNSIADERYILGQKQLLKNIKNTQFDTEKPRLDGGLLEAALDKLEGEFRRLLEDHSTPLPMPDSTHGEHSAIAPPQLPVDVIRKLHAILGRLTANGRLPRCIEIYVDVRSSIVSSSLKALDLDYLNISVAEINDAQSVERHVAQWGKHLEFAVKHLLEAEYGLCFSVFERMGPDLCAGCFARIASQVGIGSFLRFGKAVSETKKDPIKLLKLLDIFSSLNRLRLDFNRLFGGAACADIQSMTRDLIKSVIEGASEIFWELLLQVKLQEQLPPPSDAGIPRLVAFITDYSNKLLGDDYRPVLTQVLAIHKSWNRHRFQERLLVNEILGIIKAVEHNLEAWMKNYDDKIKSYLFAMNNHCHLYKHLKGTKLGGLLGDPWLGEHERLKEHYATVFMRDSWRRLPGHLSREGLLVFSGGRATVRDLVKKRLKGFNEAFDEMYRKQSGWVIVEREMRDKICQLIIQAIVPAYRSYMQNYGPLVEQDGASGKYARYSAITLEQMLSSLFQPKMGRSRSMKTRHSNEKTKENASDFRRRASAAT